MAEIEKKDVPLRAMGVELSQRMTSTDLQFALQTMMEMGFSEEKVRRWAISRLWGKPRKGSRDSCWSLGALEYAMKLVMRVVQENEILRAAGVTPLSLCPGVDEGDED